MKKVIITILIMVLLATNIYAELNPSMVYCEEMGYNYNIEKTEEGDKGLCTLPDGSSFEAWDFLKGKAGKEHSYCEKEGYILKTISDSEKCSTIFSIDCAVCVKEDGEEIEVTALMNLSFDETVCGDGICTVTEDFLTCPQDCLSGLGNDYCDGLDDGRCDPDCISGEDADCPNEVLRFETFECIDGDGICYTGCVGKDSDCEIGDASGIYHKDYVEPEDKLYPEPEIECVYDGLCYPECMGTDDIDCICIDPKSEECKKALGVEYKQVLEEEEIIEKEDVGLFTWVTLLIIFLTLIGIGGYLYKKFKEGKEKKEEKPLFPGYTRGTSISKPSGKRDIAQLKVFVNNASKKGYTKLQITQSAEKAGWTKQEIDEAMKKKKSKFSLFK